ncbi:MAG: AtpZ/AtpI family protein [Hydrogenovibrio sp.]
MESKRNEDTDKQSNRKPKPALNFLLLSAGSMFTSMIIAGFIVGYVLDQLFGTMPLFLLSCGVLGFIGGMMKVHALLGKMSLLDTPSASRKDDPKAMDKE